MVIEDQGEFYTMVQFPKALGVRLSELEQQFLPPFERGLGGKHVDGEERRTNALFNLSELNIQTTHSDHPPDWNGNYICIRWRTPARAFLRRLKGSVDSIPKPARRARRESRPKIWPKLGKKVEKNFEKRPSAYEKRGSQDEEPTLREPATTPSLDSSELRDIYVALAA